MKKVVLSISAMLFVGAVSYAQSNMSHVDQMGMTHDAMVNQIGWNQDSDISQKGTSNKSEVYQGVRPNEIKFFGVNISNGNEADVIQDGKRNTAFISQNNWGNDATQTQTGDDNKATIWQDETSGGLALFGHDKATQTQTGKHNIATIDQGTSGNTIPSFCINQVPAAPVLPHGYNVATQTQDGNYGIAYASQGGTLNNSSQTQHGTLAVAGKENVSNHFQYGTANTAISTQTGWKNNVDVFQSGSNNYANNTQTATFLAVGGNASVVCQQGSGHVSNVTQFNP